MHEIAKIRETVGHMRARIRKGFSPNAPQARLSCEMAEDLLAYSESARCGVQLDDEENEFAGPHNELARDIGNLEVTVGGLSDELDDAKKIWGSQLDEMLTRLMRHEDGKYTETTWREWACSVLELYTTIKPDGTELLSDECLMFGIEMLTTWMKK